MLSPAPRLSAPEKVNLPSSFSRLAHQRKVETRKDLIFGQKGEAVRREYDWRERPFHGMDWQPQWAEVEWEETETRSTWSGFRGFQARDVQELPRKHSPRESLGELEQILRSRLNVLRPSSCH